MSRLKIPLVLGAALLAVLGLVVTGVSNNDIYMSPLEEMDEERARREKVRLVGWVAENSVVSMEEELITRFRLRNEDASLELAMEYVGVVPDLFRGGVNVVAAGQLDEDGLFLATELMTKCPSKYEGAEDVPVPGQSPPAPDSAPLGVDEISSRD